MPDIKLNVNQTKEGIIIRTGDAPKVDESSNIEFSGDIQAPARYFGFVKDDVHPASTIVEAYMNTGRVVLTINPHSSKTKVKILGKLEQHPLITNTLFINSGNDISKRSFINALKMNRHFFADREANMKLVTQLEKLELQIEKDLKDHDQKRGTYNFAVKQICKSELPEFMTLRLPIFTGQDPQSFDVEIDFEVKDNKVYFFFISTELNEYVQREGERLINEALKAFEGEVPVIYK